MLLFFGGGFGTSMKPANRIIHFWYRLQFNIVSKGLHSDRMSHYLNEAAGDIRDLLLPTIVNEEPPKSNL